MKRKGWGIIVWKTEVIIMQIGDVSAVGPAVLGEGVSLVLVFVVVALNEGKFALGTRQLFTFTLTMGRNRGFFGLKGERAPKTAPSHRQTSALIECIPP